MPADKESICSQPSCQSPSLFSSFFCLCSFSLLFFSFNLSSSSSSLPTFSLSPPIPSFLFLSLSFHLFLNATLFSQSTPSPPPPLFFFLPILLPPLLLHPSLVRSLTQLSHSWSIPVGLAFSILRLCRGHGPPTVTVAGTNGRQSKMCVCVCVCMRACVLSSHSLSSLPSSSSSSSSSSCLPQFHHAQLPSQSATISPRPPAVLAQDSK